MAIHPPLTRTSFTLLIYAILSTTIQAHSENNGHTLDDSYKYITRPDIEAPKFNITIYDPSKVSPGYWFVPSYDFLDQKAQTGGRWCAPHIYDGRGELVWSGSYLSRQYDAFDFRISTILGEDMLSFIYPRNRSAVILDTSFNIRHIIPVAQARQSVDMHEFHLVENGTKALYFYDEDMKATKEQSRSIGYMRGRCSIKNNLIAELDVANGFERVYDWSAAAHIGLHESSNVEVALHDRCRGEGWDFLHLNSLDKFSDGSYLMSSRHTDTIYKIAPNGSILWRFGGVMSDFHSNFDFAHQHHARVLWSNENHTMISFFDNAMGTALKSATSGSSRGMIVQLHTGVRPMTAKLVQEYLHPDGQGHYVVARGSLQVLPNGNVWICWVEGLLSAEYSPDGTLIMETRVKQDWLKAYRTYKFAFTGLPTAPPDAHSQAIGSDADNTTTTLVYASWNGATEVATWHLHKTDSEGNIDTMNPISILPRTGFETALTYRGFATYVLVEAVDRYGTLLGRSEVVKTIVSAELSPLTMAREAEWLEKMYQRAEVARQAVWLISVMYENPLLSFGLGLLCGVTIVFAVKGFGQVRGRGYWRRGRGESFYRIVGMGEDGEKGRIA